MLAVPIPPWSRAVGHKLEPALESPASESPGGIAEPMPRVYDESSLG